MPDTLVDIWRQIIVGNQKSWVLFEHGTCIILMQPEQDLIAQGTEIMKRWGPVHTGSSAGDFNVIALREYPGWVVTGHHKDMLNYVSPDEISKADPADVVVGVLGRSKRNQDAEDLKVIHVEDRRSLA